MVLNYLRGKGAAPQSLPGSAIGVTIVEPRVPDLTL